MASVTIAVGEAERLAPRSSPELENGAPEAGLSGRAVRFDRSGRGRVILALGVLCLHRREFVEEHEFVEETVSPDGAGAWNANCRPRLTWRDVMPQAAARYRKWVSVYAIVRSGGRQHKVAVGDVLEVDKMVDEVGASVKLEPLLVVDGKDVTSDKAALGKVDVTAEVLGQTKGPKLNIMHYKNKTGYKRHMGHRQQYTRIKVTGIKA